MKRKSVGRAVTGRPIQVWVVIAKSFYTLSPAMKRDPIYRYMSDIPPKWQGKREVMVRKPTYELWTLKGRFFFI